VIPVSLTRPRHGLVALLVLWLLNLIRWHRATRPEPLPAPAAGSTTVLTGDGTRLHAQLGGDTDCDTTIVFVHGFLARTVEFDMQWTHFTDKARLVRYDHRNHGRSQRTAKQIDVGTLADDLAAVVEQTAPTGRVVLVGHSMGGMTILALALGHPALFRRRVSGVGLIATGPGTTSTATRRERACAGPAAASSWP
jgi:pimeloyl-ACP methyl ester carboxylesterase